MPDPILAPRRARRRSPARLALLASLLVPAACGGGAVRPPSVVLISLDTMRADHLGCYGYGRNTTPRIDAFAGRATLYRRAMAAAPWTLPTHASMMTGKYPFEHGAHSFPIDRPGNNVKPLAKSNLTLAEALAAEGYRTAAFVANDAYLSPVWQLDQGFATYHVERVRARQLNERVAAWLQAADDAPFFLFVNYMDTHRPYDTTPRPGFLDPPAVQHDGHLLDVLCSTAMPENGRIPDGLVQQVIDQYDTATANLDEQVGALLDRLDAAGRLEDAVVVVTSDHGEFFGEHALVEHSKDVYQEVLWVPLIVKAPGQREGRTVAERTSSVDLPSLILSQLAPDLAQRLLPAFPAAPGNHPVLAENYFTRSKDLFNPVWGKRFNRIRRVIYDGPLKYIASSDGHHELYDLDADPREADNLMAAQPDRAAALAARLQERLRAGGAGARSAEQPVLDERQLESLRSLGYVK